MRQELNAKKWLDDFENHQPFIIAGPCSAETETQVLTIAHALKNTKVSVFRAGIWKPRTRPGGFEGVGEVGLTWLQKAKKETGLLMATEVATAAHVKLALAHDIDVLWIGARTAVNPFAVQEIADALQNTDKIVLLKNPVNPDLSLWVGGLERLQQSNIQKLGVIHRGFSTYEKTAYRNNPEWQIAIDFQQQFPHIPMICDPSHMTGKRDMIANVSQQALDLNYNGLIVETHHDPDNAWSDAAQQVTPKVLQEILKHLKVRKTSDEGTEFLGKMEQLRLQIDGIDAKLLEILGNRMKIAEAIGALKREQNVSILQSERWNAILNKMKDDGQQKGLSEDFILKLFKAIHQESIAHQEKIFNINNVNANDSEL
jgi:chorismate mutase